jgi:AbrB family looped-hinge helix DNA binding protein
MSAWQRLSPRLQYSCKDRATCALAAAAIIAHGGIMKQFVSSVTSKGQVTIPVAVRKHLGVGTPDKITFVVEDDGDVSLRSAPLSLRDLRGIVPALPGRITSDFEDQIEDAMEEEAARIVHDVQRR